MQGMRFLTLALLLWVPAAFAQSPVPAVAGKRHPRLAIRNAIIIDGTGTPPAGPRDILIGNDRIAAIVPSRGEGGPKADVNIDAGGRYVLPGFINLHGHTQDSRARRDFPVEYCTKLWLACGITTVRDVGADWEKARKWKFASEDGTLAAPRLFLYRTFSAATVAEVDARVADFKQQGADGIKFFATPRDIMERLSQAARNHQLRLAHHAAIAETNAWDDARFGTTTIEHWYGIPDAALKNGVQGFPPSFNHDNELDRFRHAGRLWREADPERLSQVLDAMVKANVAWDPTLSIYEAARDLDKAQTQPYFAEYLHPALEEFFKPNLANHGSFYTDWTTEDEVYWKENYRIWMHALRQFAEKGGIIGTGEDAGFIYRIYGFGYLRELELQQEAGFHPLEVIQHATVNGARILGKENELGRLRQGWKADLVIVNGNPLRDFKILYPHRGGIEWTIKDGIPYHVPALSAEVKELVRAGRAKSK